MNQADDREGAGMIMWVAVAVLALVLALVTCGCEGDKRTTINEAPVIDASGKTNGIIIMQDGSGNIAAVYAETEDGSMIPITIDQVGTGNIAIVEIVVPPVLTEEDVAP
jgi:hypothetical protein